MRETRNIKKNCLFEALIESGFFRPDQKQDPKHNYQDLNLQLLRAAAQDYIDWAKENKIAKTRGLSRFSHWYHGASSVLRAEELLICIDHQLWHSYADTIAKAKKAFDDSGTANHSLARFIYHQFTAGGAALKQGNQVALGEEIFLLKDTVSCLLKDEKNHSKTNMNLWEFVDLVTRGTKVKVGKNGHRKIYLEDDSFKKILPKIQEVYSRLDLSEQERLDSDCSFNHIRAYFTDEQQFKQLKKNKNGLESLLFASADCLTAIDRRNQLLAYSSGVIC